MSMKKQKLILKVDNSNRTKIYVGGKWQKKVTKIDIFADVRGFNVTITTLKTNKNGVPYVENNDIAKETQTYRNKRGER